MTDRAAVIEAFLADSPWRDAQHRPLKGDASFRRYVRLEGGPKPAMLMDAPPPREDVRPFMTVARHLTDMGFSAPEIYQDNASAGLLVIEDLGDETYTRRLADGGDEAALYALAVDTLIALHRQPRAPSVAVPPYDEAKLLEEALLLVDWFLPAATGRATPAPLREDYRDLWRRLLPAADAAPPTLVLRDYHVDNLMWLEGRDGVRRCGLLDFQDAVIGSPAYDLASLLEDARRDVPGDLAAAMTARYFDAFPKIDRAGFETAGAVLAAQRNCKIIGIFTRLLARDGKDIYLRHIPRVWRLLERDVRRPALAPLRAWLDRHVPSDLRRIPDVKVRA